MENVRDDLVVESKEWMDGWDLVGMIVCLRVDIVSIYYYHRRITLYIKRKGERRYITRLNYHTQYLFKSTSLLICVA